MKTYLYGLAVTLAVPFVFSYIKSKLVPMLVAYQMKQLLALLKADTGDIALDEFEKDLTFAVIKLAQAKFRTNGAGDERKRFVIDFLVSKVPLLKGQEDHLSDLIDELVREEKEMLVKIRPA